MSACVPTRTDHSSRATGAPRSKRPHSPPPGDGRRRRFRIAGADLSASISVFLIALPLSLGIALATGAPLQAGLVAAAVGGLVAGRFGGAPLQVSGPAAGLTVVTADLIQQYGWRTTCAITVVAGLAQLALSAVRVARSALAVSPAIVHGMLAGIGATIALSQLHIVLGGTPQSSAVENVQGLPAQLANLHGPAILVSALTVTVLLLWPHIPGRTGRIAHKVPAALVAVFAGAALAALTRMEVPRVDLPSWSSHALPELPEGPVLGIAAAVLTVTLVTSVQSLLSAVAVDKLVSARKTPPAEGTRSNLDRELAGQGAANVVSGALGGLPVAGVAVRSVANVSAGAVSRHSTMLHGVWIALAALFLVPVIDLIPLPALAALVMVVGFQMVSVAHIRSASRHREMLVYAVTVAGVVLLGVLEGVAMGIGVAVAVALHRLAKTHVTAETTADGAHHIRVRGQLTFLAVPRLSRALNQVPHGADAVVELDGSFMDHAAYETLQDWQVAHAAQGGRVEITGRSGQRFTGPAPGAGSPDFADFTDPHFAGSANSTGSPARSTQSAHTCCRPWTPWRNHHCGDHAAAPSAARRGRAAGGAGQLATGLSAFQRNTAPLVREELARLAREGQTPSQLFITCADSRLVTSMITSSGPGDLFTVRNVGNLVPPPGAENTDDSVGAAIEYAVDVLKVQSITVCGHSGCGAMQALLNTPLNTPSDAAQTPLRRWLRHGAPSLERMRSRKHSWARISGRLPADAVEQLCLTNVVQQLENLRTHEAVRRRLDEGTLELHGMYFHVGEAQAYLLQDGMRIGETCEVFDRVGPSDAEAPEGSEGSESQDGSDGSDGSLEESRA
ncbi:bifunctional SulP family inorganic anion transporter/carbonic anhydrase [Streptomyces sp. ISL-96]|uniref:bifunctional SulP family inorganic anion transporter/carbonic anhydrase n=1 Tax=Streptomyces sp. ISL-96 TaxID=2819191 RepID=UPI001BE73EC8|nr:bifunctional SulP family inorganic anion transporter/carbonic anhydrase [Streptomyces sp. ISL-96]MBT2487844.1 bifunctional SulP family inorganic anion transporter/carbonic anhydrase [Streptomyces sp. ISL-96]